MEQSIYDGQEISKILVVLQGKFKKITVKIVKGIFINKSENNTIASTTGSSNKISCR